MKLGSVALAWVGRWRKGFAAALAEIIASWPWLELDLVVDCHTVSGA